MEMEKVLEVINQIQGTSGRNDKESIIKKNKIMNYLRIFSNLCTQPK